MKIILCSDFHLAFSQQFDRININGLSCRLQEILDSIKWAADLGKQKKAAYFFGLGDIFDKAEKLPTKEGLAIQDIFKYIATLYKNKCGLLTGNHDKISDAVSILDLFSQNIQIFNQFTVIDTDDARLFFVPYLREPEDFYSVMTNIQNNFDTPGKKYLFGHFWDLSVMGVDAEAIDVTKFNVSFFDRIFCGHYHAPTQDLTNRIIYVGTLLNKKFNETGPKGCWILDLEKNKLEFHKNPHSPEFYSIEDSTLLHDNSIVQTNAYYRAYCDADTVTEVSRILSACKGYEILSKKDSLSQTQNISIDSVDKKNNQTLKEYVLANCDIFVPDGITKDEFKVRGSELLSDL